MDILQWPLERIRQWIAEHRAALQAAERSASALAALELPPEQAAERDRLIAELEEPLQESNFRHHLQVLEDHFGRPRVGVLPGLVIGALVVLSAGIIGSTYVAWLWNRNAEQERALERWKRELDPERRLPDDPSPGLGWGFVVLGLVGGSALVLFSQRGRR